MKNGINKIFNILFSFILLFSVSVLAQSINKKAQKLYDAAILSLQNRKFDVAKTLFEDATQKDDCFTDAHYQLGILYKKYERNTDKIKFHFEKIMACNPNYPMPSIRRILAETYLHQGNYEDAKKYFTSYLTYEKELPQYLEKSKLLLKHCNYALENKKNKVEINVKPLSNQVNNHKSQYFPVATADQKSLVFTIRDFIGFQEYEDIYISKKLNGEWSQPQSISDNINSAKYNEGTASISADGRTLTFAICGGPNQIDKDCDLYISYKKGEIWTEPVNMGETVNSPAWDSQPSLSGDGKTIYFSSKRKGGFGEEDIWMTQSDASGRWNLPVNMGDLINTKGREVAPFIHPSLTTLYFSSDFHLGFGSFDLFVSYKDSVNWNEPKNLGYPINTHLDESAIFITSDCKKAYFSAEEQTNKNSDRYLLYEFEMPKSVSCQNISTYIKGTTFDNYTKKNISAEVEVINLKTNKTESFLTSDLVDGSYLAILNENTQYGLYVNKQGYLYKSHAFTFENLKTFDPINLDIYLDPIKKGTSITLNNIFFSTGKYELQKSSQTELDKLVNFLNQNIDLKVEIAGHTDNVGLKSNNLALSTRRAESVQNYLIEKGIDEVRIIAKGYGDLQPKALNDTEENKQMNRRIECKIL
ncbi:MAG: hypothetical protein EAZ27_07295 [Cytophagales bacterium]|nr:MAG: hypothetical protein EAZ27_07295 [Cytophagales bacterium]